MFQHSVKVPRHYKIAANIFKKVSTEGGSVKTLLYDEKLRHFRTNVLYALITETIKHAADIDKIFENCNILEKESRLDPWLAKVLTAELLFGKKSLPGKSKPEQTVSSYKDQFEQYTSEHQDDLKTEENVLNRYEPPAVRRPRYVRINTNSLTTSDAIGAFQDEGYRFIRCTAGSYDDYLAQIQQLTEYDFTQDYHVKTVFVFSSGTKLHEHELYLENKIILQDKATTLAVHLLAPPAGSVALDLCAAPGMKTTQLAAYMRNQGRIYAVERNENRYQTLCDFVKKTESKCVETLHKDALEIKRGDLDDVEYILLDPSCSGSGMELCVHNYIEATRLAKLTSLQEKFLKHAMNAFPKAKRIVYSTCSLYPEENERVITNVVKTSRAKWRVQDVKELLKGQWNNFGSSMYGSMGTRCLYARPDKDLTTGFFLAVLDRDPKDMEKSLNYKLKPNNSERYEGDEDNTSSKKSRKKLKRVDDNQTEDSEPEKKKKKTQENNKTVEEVQETDINIEQNAVSKKKKKEKDKHKEKDVNESDVFEETVEIGEDEGVAPKKKKKKKHEHEEDDVEVTVHSNDECTDVLKKKKKKSKEKDLEQTSDAIAYLPEEVSVRKKKKKKDKNVETES